MPGFGFMVAIADRWAHEAQPLNPKDLHNRRLTKAYINLKVFLKPKPQKPKLPALGSGSGLLYDP